MAKSTKKFLKLLMSSTLLLSVTSEIAWSASGVEFAPPASNRSSLPAPKKRSLIGMAKDELNQPKTQDELKRQSIERFENLLKAPVKKSRMYRTNSLPSISNHADNTSALERTSNTRKIEEDYNDQYIKLVRNVVIEGLGKYNEEIFYKPFEEQENQKESKALFETIGNIPANLKEERKKVDKPYVNTGKDPITERQQEVFYNRQKAEKIKPIDNLIKEIESLTAVFNSLSFSERSDVIRTLFRDEFINEHLDRIASGKGLDDVVTMGLVEKIGKKGEEVVTQAFELAVQKRLASTSKDVLVEAVNLKKLTEQFENIKTFVEPIQEKLDKQIDEFMEGNPHIVKIRELSDIGAVKSHVDEIRRAPEEYLKTGAPELEFDKILKIAEIRKKELASIEKEKQKEVQESIVKNVEKLLKGESHNLGKLDEKKFEVLLSAIQQEEKEWKTTLANPKSLAFIDLESKIETREREIKDSIKDSIPEEESNEYLAKLTRALGPVKDAIAKSKEELYISFVDSIIKNEKLDEYPGQRDADLDSLTNLLQGKLNATIQLGNLYEAKKQVGYIKRGLEQKYTKDYIKTVIGEIDQDLDSKIATMERKKRGSLNPEDQEAIFFKKAESIIKKHLYSDAEIEEDELNSKPKIYRGGEDSKEFTANFLNTVVANITTQDIDWVFTDPKKAIKDPRLASVLKAVSIISKASKEIAADDDEEFKKRFSNLNLLSDIEIVQLVQESYKKAHKTEVEEFRAALLDEAILDLARGNKIDDPITLKFFAEEDKGRLLEKIEETKGLSVAQLDSLKKGMVKIVQDPNANKAITATIEDKIISQFVGNLGSTVNDILGSMKDAKSFLSEEGKKVIINRGEERIAEIYREKLLKDPENAVTIKQEFNGHVSDASKRKEFGNLVEAQSLKEDYFNAAIEAWTEGKVSNQTFSNGLNEQISGSEERFKAKLEEVISSEKSTGTLISLKEGVGTLQDSKIKENASNKIDEKLVEAFFGQIASIPDAGDIIKAKERVIKVIGAEQIGNIQKIADKRLFTIYQAGLDGASSNSAVEELKKNIAQHITNGTKKERLEELAKLKSSELRSQGGSNQPGLYRGLSWLSRDSLPIEQYTSSTPSEKSIEEQFADLEVGKNPPNDDKGFDLMAELNAAEEKEEVAEVLKKEDSVKEDDSFKKPPFPITAKELDEAKGLLKSLPPKDEAAASGSTTADLFNEPILDALKPRVEEIDPLGLQAELNSLAPGRAKIYVKEISKYGNLDTLFADKEKASTSAKDEESGAEENVVYNNVDEGDLVAGPVPNIKESQPEPSMQSELGISQGGDKSISAPLMKEPPSFSAPITEGNKPKAKENVVYKLVEETFIDEPSKIDMTPGARAKEIETQESPKAERAILSSEDDSIDFSVGLPEIKKLVDTKSFTVEKSTLTSELQSITMEEVKMPQLQAAVQIPLPLKEETAENLVYNKPIEQFAAMVAEPIPSLSDEARRKFAEALSKVEGTDGFIKGNIKNKIPGSTTADFEGAGIADLFNEPILDALKPKVEEIDPLGLQAELNSLAPGRAEIYVKEISKYGNLGTLFADKEKASTSTKDKKSGAEENVVYNTGAFGVPKEEVKEQAEKELPDSVILPEVTGPVPNIKESQPEPSTLPLVASTKSTVQDPAPLGIFQGGDNSISAPLMREPPSFSTPITEGNKPKAKENVVYKLVEETFIDEPSKIDMTPGARAKEIETQESPKAERAILSSEDDSIDFSVGLPEIKKLVDNFVDSANKLGVIDAPIASKVPEALGIAKVIEMEEVKMPQPQAMVAEPIPSLSNEAEEKFNEALSVAKKTKAFMDSNIRNKAALVATTMEAPEPMKNILMKAPAPDKSAARAIVPDSIPVAPPAPSSGVYKPTDAITPSTLKEALTGIKTGIKKGDLDTLFAEPVTVAPKIPAVPDTGFKGLDTGPVVSAAPKAPIMSSAVPDMAPTGPADMSLIAPHTGPVVSAAPYTAPTGPVVSAVKSPAASSSSKAPGSAGSDGVEDGDLDGLFPDTTSVSAIPATALAASVTSPKAPSGPTVPVISPSAPAASVTSPKAPVTHAPPSSAVLVGPVKKPGSTSLVLPKILVGIGSGPAKSDPEPDLDSGSKSSSDSESDSEESSYSDFKGAEESGSNEPKASEKSPDLEVSERVSVEYPKSESESKSESKSNNIAAGSSNSNESGSSKSEPAQTASKTETAKPKENPVTKDLLGADDIQNLNEGLEFISFLYKNGLNDIERRASRASAIGMGSGDNDMDREYGIWGRYNFGNAKQKESKNHEAFKANFNGGVIGADTLINDKYLLGAAYSYTDLETNYKSVSNPKSNTYTHMAFGYFSWFMTDNFSYSAKPTYGKLTKTRGENKLKGRLFGLRQQVAYNINLEKFAVTPTFAVDYRNVKFNKVRSLVNNDLLFNKFKAEFFGIEGGLNLNKKFEFSSYELTPNLNLNVIYNLAENKNFNLAKPLDYDTVANYEQVKSPKIYYSIGTGMSLVKNRKFELGLKYNFMFKSKFRSNSGSAVFKVKF